MVAARDHRGLDEARPANVWSAAQLRPGHQPAALAHISCASKTCSPPNGDLGSDLPVRARGVSQPLQRATFNQSPRSIVGPVCCRWRSSVTTSDVVLAQARSTPQKEERTTRGAAVRLASDSALIQWCVRAPGSGGRAADLRSAAVMLAIRSDVAAHGVGDSPCGQAARRTRLSHSSKSGTLDPASSPRRREHQVAGVRSRT